ncbi:Dual Oxidase 2 [Manis pentadactyla]|nr:Dual Oxidase 2 [Manis pentadactyla]
MDRTPASMAVIFKSPPATHGPVGSTTAGLLCTQTPTTHPVIIWSPLDPYDAMECTDDGLGLTQMRKEPPTNNKTTPLRRKHKQRTRRDLESYPTGPERGVITAAAAAAAADGGCPTGSLLIAIKAVGGKDNGLGPTPNSDDEPTGMPPPSGKAPTPEYPAPDKAMGNKSAVLKADADAQDEPVDTTPPWLAMTLRSPPAPHKAVGSTTSGSKADNDARDEPMDTTQPSMAVIFQSPTVTHEAVGGTTAGLLCT